MTIQRREHGVLLAERADPPKGHLLRPWLDGSVAAGFDQRVPAVDATVARRAATLHVSDPAPFRDAHIGATALVHQMAMVTRNVKGLRPLRWLDTIEPWLSQ